MKRHAAMMALATSLVALASIAYGGTTAGVDIHLTIGDAPPPPAIVFEAPPRVVVVPTTSVYYVADDYGYDVFRCGAYWFVFHDGWWYRARRYGGPYAVVEARYVPRAVINVPPRYWRHPHGGPPGQRKKENVAVYKQKGHGKGHGPWRDD